MDLKNINELKRDWEALLIYIRSQFEIDPDLQGILFLIGIQELGQGPRKFTKEEKQDLMHIAVCRLLSDFGYYKLLGTDSNGWPHWQNIKTIPKLSLKDQDILLKQSTIEYFRNDVGVISADNN